MDWFANAHWERLVVVAAADAGDVVVVDTTPRMVFLTEAWWNADNWELLAVAFDNPVRVPWFVQRNATLAIHSNHRTTVRPVTALALLLVNMCCFFQLDCVVLVDPSL